MKDLNNALSEVGAKLRECEMQRQLLFEKEVQRYKEDQLQQKGLKEE